MKPFPCIGPLALSMLVPFTLPAAVRYVNVSNSAPVWPYDAWSNAATRIQDALDAAVSGDQILVTNGVYQTGGRVVDGSMSNRVAVVKAVTVQSVNGPAVTVIQGYQVPGGPYGCGNSAIRCAYLTDGAALIGFTLTNGATRSSGSFYEEQCGAGVWCGPSAVLSNCVLTGHSAYNFGGAAYRGTLNNCTLAGNQAYRGGAAIAATLNGCQVISNRSDRLGGGVSDCTLDRCTLTGNYGWNGGGGWSSTFSNCILTGNSAATGGGGEASTFNNCTLTGNSASNLGGGTDGGTLNNSILYYNQGGNYSGSVFHFSCTTPDPGGPGNITSEPMFVNPGAGDWRLQSNSPCINTGSNGYVTASNDRAGNPRVVQEVVDMGAYEFQTSVPWIVSIQANSTSAAPGFSLSFTSSFLGGLATATVWDFGDGTSVSNQLSVSHSWTMAGLYPVVLRAFNAGNPDGVSASVTVQVAGQAVRYVAVDNPGATWPYTNWAGAAANIQDALDAAGSGDLVLVTNGVYRTGGRLVPGTTTLSRAAVTTAVTLQSVGGAAVTTIDGAGAARGVYLAGGASLIGFTVTNGATSATGGGIWCSSRSNLVGKCIIGGNTAITGGGAYRGTLVDCVLTRNVSSSSSQGIAYDANLIDCTLSDNNNVAAYSTLNRCTLMRNIQGYAYQCRLTNCVLTANPQGAGFMCVMANCLLTANGATASMADTLINCTIVANTNGIYDSMAYNCIVYGNDASGGANYYFDHEFSPSGFNYSCTTPLPDSGVGNITNPPLFVNEAGGDFRLQSNSPCINSGINTRVGCLIDLAGNPRIAGGTVDLGAYEYPAPGSLISYAWLLQFGLTTSGTADYADPDGDGMNNWQEWIADTNPTNSWSRLKMQAPARTNSSGGLVVRWESVNTRTYYLQRGTDLTTQPPLSTIQSNIAGLTGVTSYTDTNATSSRAYFYRVGVQ